MDLAEPPRPDQPGPPAYAAAASIKEASKPAMWIAIGSVVVAIALVIGGAIRKKNA
jgi:hypothetical protein